MKRKFYYVLEVLLTLIIFPIAVNANIMCNDGTMSSTCTDCHRGCCSHHGGCASNSSNAGSIIDNSSISNSSREQQNYIKSSDTSLKEISIDNEKIDIFSDMSYSTTKEIVKIDVVPNDEKAVVKYINEAKLNIGENIININVKAENGNVKDYKLNIIREQTLSDNTNIKIKVNDKYIDFYSYKSNPINLSNNEDKLNIDYELEDENATVEILGNENLKIGKNEIIIKVVAENGKEQDYTIIVEKTENYDGVSAVITIGLLGGIGYLIYSFVKKKRIR